MFQDTNTTAAQLRGEASTLDKSNREELPVGSVSNGKLLVWQLMRRVGRLVSQGRASDPNICLHPTLRRPRYALFPAKICFISQECALNHKMARVEP